ncbi:ribokinase [Stieleria sp. JC731]|uniref:ribokinase n=1 Tax=Pirellulaceae TaxID=2691357 RepID=UPI001E47B5CC|nr:ribokinase [Stieleria sp. JC731]MCC9601342.1 ribokinase [Stieleria sp. JC731]
MSRPRIAVLGSINMDLVVRCENLPRPGETISANHFSEIPGGKGANQAVAAARAGADVHLIGRVGDDGFGKTLLNHLREQGVGCESVQITEQTPSGVAVVAVEQSGENSIIVVPGANGRVAIDDVHQHADVIRQSDVLMVQLETPLRSVEAAIEIARSANVKVILDPAPASVLPPSLLNVDVICPNESEAASITGQPCGDIHQAMQVAESLQRSGAQVAIITLGDQGTIVHDGLSATMIPSFPINAVDTTAAGDAFAGTLAVRLAMGIGLQKSVQLANAAGALAASTAGAQPSLPFADQVDRFAASLAPHDSDV